MEEDTSRDRNGTPETPFDLTKEELQLNDNYSGTLKDPNRSNWTLPQGGEEAQVPRERAAGGAAGGAEPRS